MQEDIDNVGTDEPIVHERVVIERIYLQGDGDCIISLRSDEVFTDVMLPSYVMTWQMMRQLRRWSRHRANLTVTLDPESHRVIGVQSLQLESDSIDEVLDAAQGLLASGQLLASSLWKLAIGEPRRRALNRYLNAPAAITRK